MFEVLFKHKGLFDLKSKHDYSTRSLDVTYPSHRLTLTEKCPHYMCLKLFNALPDRLKIINSQKLFKKELKKLLIEMEPYSMQDFCKNL